MRLATLCSILAAVAALGATAIAPAQSSDGKVVVGQVGQVLEKVKVHSRPSSRSKVYFSVKEDEFIVVLNSAPKGWVKVLLSNGQYGYADADAFELLQFEVTADKPSARSAYVASRSSAPRTNGSVREAAAETGLDFLGTPYVWGGNDITHGIDCSGFVQKLYGNFGVPLPRTAAEQATVGEKITRLENLRKGDRLYFWDAKRGKIGHTGLYLGNGRFVHSSSGRGGVAVDDLRNGKWLKILVDARR
jgi:cell wall-associated NlpC family hydrolase